MSQDKEMKDTAPQATVSLTKQDLADVVAAAVSAAIAAAKAPNVIEQAKLDREKQQIEQDQANRLKTSQGVLDDIKAKRFTQATCSHEHPDGHTHCVYVMERIGPGYLLCQKNQCIIRPGQASPNYDQLRTQRSTSGASLRCRCEGDVLSVREVKFCGSR